MRIHLVYIDKTAFRDIESAVERYMARLQHYCPVEVHIIRGAKITGAVSDDMVMARESEKILKLAGGQGHRVVWDRRGREIDSAGLAKLLQKLIVSGTSHLWMVIGGPVGVSPQLLKSAHEVLSFSKMTFPHDLVRLMLVEQLYRAFTIMKGEPYHR